MCQSAGPLARGHVDRELGPVLAPGLVGHVDGDVGIQLHVFLGPFQFVLVPVEGPLPVFERDGFAVVDAVLLDIGDAGGGIGQVEDVVGDLDRADFHHRAHVGRHVAVGRASGGTRGNSGSGSHACTKTQEGPSGQSRVMHTTLLF